MKKVILIIVEGQTEEAIFFDYLQERFTDAEVRIHVQAGDVLSDLRNKKNIKKVVGQLIRDYLEKYRFLPNDVLAVLHFTDTDGCFVVDDQVVVDSTAEKNLFYDEESIIVPDDNKKQMIQQRNEQKAQNIRILSADHHFSIRSIKIPYQLYYFSTNLDHVLWDERNTKGYEKLEKVDRFLEQFHTNIDQFLWQFVEGKQQGLYTDKYKHSWEYIMEGNHSLSRKTNMPFLLEMIDALSSEPFSSN